MVHVAGLVAMNGSKSVLTRQGRRAVEKPAWEVIGEIWRKWTANKEYDEFNRIDIIKGQSVKRALEAIEAGQDPDGFARFLEERDDQPLPETAVAFLKQARENGEAVRQSGVAILFECRDARTADMISACKDLSNICLRAGETTLAVREEGLAKFRKQVRLFGLGIR